MKKIPKKAFSPPPRGINTPISLQKGVKGGIFRALRGVVFLLCKSDGVTCHPEWRVPRTRNRTP